MSPSERPSEPPGAAEALRRLRAGNVRFVQGVRNVDSLLGAAARRSLVAAQKPTAIAGGELLVVGAEYSLERGEVDFFDGVPTWA